MIRKSGNRFSEKIMLKQSDAILIALAALFLIGLHQAGGIAPLATIR